MLRPAPPAAVGAGICWSGMIPTVAWENGVVVMIDQRRLPAEQVTLRCRDHHEVAERSRRRSAAHRRSVCGRVRSLGAANSRAEPASCARSGGICSELATRPTAVNLFWRSSGCGSGLTRSPRGGDTLRKALLAGR
jgi:methylthioribose-1-phosphate isomerase